MQGGARTLMKSIWPANSAASCSKTGAIMRHGPHLQARERRAQEVEAPKCIQERGRSNFFAAAAKRFKERGRSIFFAAAAKRGSIFYFCSVRQQRLFSPSPFAAHQVAVKSTTTARPMLSAMASAVSNSSFVAGEATIP